MKKRIFVMSRINRKIVTVHPKFLKNPNNNDFSKSLLPSLPS